MPRRGRRGERGLRRARRVRDEWAWAEQRVRPRTRDAVRSGGAGSRASCPRSSARSASSPSSASTSPPGRRRPSCAPSTRCPLVRDGDRERARRRVRVRRARAARGPRPVARARGRSRSRAPRSSRAAPASRSRSRSRAPATSGSTGSSLDLFLLALVVRAARARVRAALRPARLPPRLAHGPRALLREPRARAGARRCSTSRRRCCSSASPARPRSRRRSPRSRSRSSSLEIVLVADLAGYAAHRAFHAVPCLWRFHAVHHSSEAMDWLAGSRLHLVDVVATRAAVFVPLFAARLRARRADRVPRVGRVHATWIHANLRFRYGAARARPRDAALPPLAPRGGARGARQELRRPPAVDRPRSSARTTCRPLRWPERYGIDEPMPAGWLGQLWFPFR